MFEVLMGKKNRPKIELEKDQISKIAEFNYEAEQLYIKLFSKDENHCPWAQLDDFQKQVVRNDVKNALDIYTSDNDCHPYSKLHEDWMRDKLRKGWRYGKQEDFENKVHPCLLPYNDLPIVDVFKYVLSFDNTVALSKHYHALSEGREDI